MGVKSRGRGTAAAIGLFLLFAGLVGGGVLYFVAQRRPAQSVDGFARAPVGCTTTLEFTETGTFYVFEEVGAAGADVAGDCQPVATPGARFSVEFTGAPVPGSVLADDSITYDVDGLDGRSVDRVEIAEPGQYTVAVTGTDLTVVAALGRDPDDGVADLRRTALTVAALGIGAGLVLLFFAGRRSKKAAFVATPEGPGWGPKVRPAGAWPPEAPRLDQIPVHPHQPNEPADVTHPQPVAPAAWQPPTGPVSAELPTPEPTDAPATVDPVLPKTQGRPSGT